MDDILKVSSNKEISQTGDVNNSCSNNLCDKSTEKSEGIGSPSKSYESDEKKALPLLEKRDTIKVI